VTDEQRLRQIEDIIAAARRYRDLMRQYMAEQTDLIARGVPLDEFVASNSARFTEAAAAEDELFALVDEYDAQRGQP
jgi:hypothetical protein